MARVKPLEASEVVTETPAVITEAPEYHAWKHPSYVAAENKVQELKTRLVKIQGRIDAENTRIATARATNRRLAVAQAMFSGGDPPAPQHSEDLAALQDEAECLY